uniref:Uncharacterized protein n=1 Tax=Meloidogyne enterolobii TaxID=390850 RepID=A0A6V7UD06_MELEN|nr:unnamed protein product [Meloidogyne enterolobii]
MFSKICHAIHVDEFLSHPTLLQDHIHSQFHAKDCCLHQILEIFQPLLFLIY